MHTEPTVNIVDAITLVVGVAVAVSMAILRWRRRGQVFDEERIGKDLLNGITLVPFAMLTMTVFYPTILDEIAKSPLFATIAGILAIVRVIAELYRTV